MGFFHELSTRLNSMLLLGARASVGASVIAFLSMAESSVAACEFFSVPQSYNTSTRLDDSGEVVVIGHQPDRPYRVIVVSPEDETHSNEAHNNETHNNETLGEIRACVLDAFATRSGLGDYIQVASFERRGDAEVIDRVLSQSGYQSRVIYDR